MRSIKKGATSQSVYFEFLDTTSSTGGRKTGLAFNTASLTAYYVRNQGTAVAITLATLAAANSAWSSGGFKEVDATNMPGLYRLDVPDAAFATGADGVVITMKGATGMAQASLELALIDNNSADVMSRLGAPAGASVSADVAAVKTDTAAIKTKTDSLTFTVAGMIDSNVIDWKGATAPAMTGDAFARLGAPVGASISADISVVGGYIDTEVGALQTTATAIKTQTDKMVFTVANQLDVNVLDWKSATAPAMTGDAFARLGAPAGASVSADVAAVKAVLPSALVSGRMDVSVGAYQSGQAPLQPTVAGRTLDVSTTGEAGLDWANIGSPTTTVNFSGSTIATSQAVASVTGAVGSVTGAVGSVTGNVGGNVTGSVGSLAAQAKTDAENAVWNAVLSGHLTAGTTGNALNAAGSAGDPWSTTLPGAYGAGTAGNIIGNRIDAAISSRMASFSYTAPDNTSIAAIKAKTDNLPSDPADASDIAGAFGAVNTNVGTVNTNVLAVKAKTDNLPAAPAAVGDIPTANANADALLDRAAGVETGWTVRQSFRIWNAAMFGKANGLATATVHFRDPADAKNRITATVDTDGNRTAVALDAS